MFTSPQGLEPRERDPVAIRRTLFVLIAICLAGVFVALSYVKTLERQSGVYRPPVKQGLIGAGNLMLTRHDRKAISLSDLQGQVWLCALVATTEPDRGELGREIMKDLSETFAETNRLRCVLMTIDSENDRVTQLQEFAKDLDVSLPDWWLVGADSERLHKYVQSKMKFGQFPHRAENEAGEDEWIYDTSVMLVDPTLHIRRHYDFDKAAKLDRAAEEAGEPALYLAELRRLAEQDIRYILENPL